MNLLNDYNWLFYKFLVTDDMMGARRVCLVINIIAIILLIFVCVCIGSFEENYLKRFKNVFYCSDFRYESNGIFVLGVGFFFLQTNFDFLSSHF